MLFEITSKENLEGCLVFMETPYCFQAPWTRMLVKSIWTFLTRSSVLFFSLSSLSPTNHLSWLFYPQWPSFLPNFFFSPFHLSDPFSKAPLPPHSPFPFGFYSYLLILPLLLAFIPPSLICFPSRPLFCPPHLSSFYFLWTILTQPCAIISIF